MAREIIVSNIIDLNQEEEIKVTGDVAGNECTQLTAKFRDRQAVSDTPTDDMYRQCPKETVAVGAG